MKKDNKCGLSCRCDDKICQNQVISSECRTYICNNMEIIFIDILQKSESNQENKENINRTDIETPKKQSRKKNEAVERTKDNRSLFSPDVHMRQHYKDLEEGHFNDIYFSFNENNTITKKNLDSDKNDNIESKKKKKEKKETGSSNTDNVEFKKKKEENKKEQQESTEKVERNENKRTSEFLFLLTRTIFLRSMKI